MQKIIYLLTCLLATLTVFSQQKDPFTDSAAIYFNELKEIAPRLEAIWNKPLYGPLLLVNPDTRRYYANFPDSVLATQAANGVYTGILPAQQNLANTALQLGALYRQSPRWNRQITAATNLTGLFIRQFPLSIPASLKERITALSACYHTDSIVTTETARDVKRQAQIALYKQQFIEGPHFEIKFVKMSASFDPRNIQPLEDKGTVYPTIRVSDQWGILEVQQGALMSPDWDRITVSVPLKTEGRNLSGTGWTLILNEGWQVVKEAAGGSNYVLLKQ